MYEFTRKIVADTPTGNREFRVGEQINPGDVLAGCFASLTRTGVLVPVPVSEASGLDPETESGADPDTGADANEKTGRRRR